EDGIRDFHVTGVQTCALPIWGHPGFERPSAPFRPSETRSIRRASSLLRSTRTPWGSAIGPSSKQLRFTGAPHFSHSTPMPRESKIGRASRRETVEIARRGGRL